MAELITVEASLRFRLQIAEEKVEHLEREIRELREDARIGKSRMVVGWLRGHQFIDLPENSISTDTPVFKLNLRNPILDLIDDRESDGSIA